MYKMLCFIIFIISLTACENSLQEVEMYSAEIDVNKEHGTNVEILYSEKAVIQVKIKAPTLIKFKGEDPYMEMPDKVEMFFYDEAGNVASQLEADYGITFEKRKTMKAVGNVFLVNSKGEQLNAEELIWDQNKKKIYSDKFVKVTTEDEIMFGNGFESNEDFSEYKVKKLTGQLKIDKDEIEN